MALPSADNTLSENYVAGAGGIGNHINTTGTWRVNLDGKVQTIGDGTAGMADALVYDADFDEWTINVAGQNLALINDTTDIYWSECTPSSSSCALFELYDNDGNPATTQYGTFGYVSYEDAARWVQYYVYAGLKTPSTDMPGSGTGTYTGGTFNGSVNYKDPAFPDRLYFDSVVGDAVVTAKFGADGSTVDFSSTGTTTDGVGSYELNGTATISGNTYSDTGTVTGWFKEIAGSATTELQLDATGAGSTLSGAFYGPDQIGSGETAGAVYATSAAGDPNWGEFAGGFWAPQTGYAP